jgi:hypothetical protein
MARRRADEQRAKYEAAMAEKRARAERPRVVKPASINEFVAFAIEGMIEKLPEEKRAAARERAHRTIFRDEEDYTNPHIE